MQANIAMEALWKVEEKWNPTTQQALLLLGCTAFALIGLCAAAVLKMRRTQTASHRSEPGGSNSWAKLRTKLRWSGAHKLKLDHHMHLLAASNSFSPLWQRPILMGDKCELPKFSGLILYDQTGTLLHHSFSSSPQEKSAGGMRTMLKDLLI